MNTILIISIFSLKYFLDVNLQVAAERQTHCLQPNGHINITALSGTSPFHYSVFESRFLLIYILLTFFQDKQRH